jgi:hypothetical protein
MRSASLPVVLSILMCGASTVVEATDPPAQAPKPVPAQATPAQPVSTTTSTSSSPTSDLGKSADLATLENMSGGTDVSNRINMHGDVSNNSANDIVTGNNSIDSGSFANSAGLPMVIQNSGNNVLIQNATIVSVQLQP